jgi:hypothetical protein
MAGDNLTNAIDVPESPPKKEPRRKELAGKSPSGAKLKSGRGPRPKYPAGSIDVVTWNLVPQRDELAAHSNCHRVERCIPGHRLGELAHHSAPTAG